MDITLHLMSVDEKAFLIRMMELYNYEFSAFSNDDINEYGFYGYDHIDDYWNEKGRFPYLIRVDGKIAGFALICPHCDYREVCYWKNNVPASLFWKKVIEEYTNEHYHICGTESSHNCGFTFER